MRRKTIWYGCELFILSCIFSSLHTLISCMRQYYSIFSHSPTWDVISLHCKCFKPYQVSDIITRPGFSINAMLKYSFCQFIIVVYKHVWPNDVFSFTTYMHHTRHAHGRCTCIGALSIIPSSANAPRDTSATSRTTLDHTFICHILCLPTCRVPAVLVVRPMGLKGASGDCLEFNVDGNLAGYRSGARVQLKSGPQTGSAAFIRKGAASRETSAAGCPVRMWLE